MGRGGGNTAAKADSGVLAAAAATETAPSQTASESDAAAAPVVGTTPTATTSPTSFPKATDARGAATKALAASTKALNRLGADDTVVIAGGGIAGLALAAALQAGKHTPFRLNVLHTFWWTETVPKTTAARVATAEAAAETAAAKAVAVCRQSVRNKSTYVKLTRGRVEAPGCRHRTRRPPRRARK